MRRVKPIPAEFWSFGESLEINQYMYQIMRRSLHTIATRIFCLYLSVVPGINVRSLSAPLTVSQTCGIAAWKDVRHTYSSRAHDFRSVNWHTRDASSGMWRTDILVGAKLNHVE